MDRALAYRTFPKCPYGISVLDFDAVIAESLFAAGERRWHLSVDSSLIPKVNAWLLQHMHARPVKCETLDKRVTSVDQVEADSVMLTASSQTVVIAVKGLRYLISLHDNCFKFFFVSTDCKPLNCG